VRFKETNTRMLTFVRFQVLTAASMIRDPDDGGSTYL
jgi:hypothetical protein